MLYNDVYFYRLNRPAPMIRLVLITLLVLLPLIPGRGGTFSSFQTSAANKGSLSLAHRPSALPNITNAPSSVKSPEKSAPAPKLTRPEDLPSGLYAAWQQSQAQEAVSDSGYRLAAAGTGELKGSNPTQGLELSFQSSGVTVNGMNLALTGIGYQGQALEPLEQVAPITIDSRVEYQRSPSLTEWYVNKADGLEQGFTLAQAWPGENGNELALEISLTGGLFHSAGDGLTLTSDKGNLHRYGGLYAYDATGRALPSRMEITSDGQPNNQTARLLVNLEGAQYPIVIDPLLQAQTTLTAADGLANDQFGSAVALSSDGQTALIGVPGKGGAYIFVQSGGSWILQQELFGSASDKFGSAVALSSDGQTALVGAYYMTLNGKTQQGGAYLFVRNGTIWSQQQQLVDTSTGAVGDWFGYAVSLNSNGNTALIGAPYKAINGSTHQGAAYVFTRTGTTWVQEQILTDTTTGAANDCFGWAVSLSGDGNTALIGASYKTINGNIYQGAAYIFGRSGATWTQQGSPLTASNGAAQDVFGYAAVLSSDGNTALISAYLKNGWSGAAYVFVRSGNAWIQQGILTANNGAVSDWFGRAVSLSSDGNTALIGAYGKNSKGVAYTFGRSGNIWTQQGSNLTAGSDAAVNDQFGWSVSLSGYGSTALIGANNKQIGTNAAQGRVYIFATPPTTITLTANPATTSTYGQTVTLTATISPITATGTVVFKDGTTTLNGSPATIVNGVATFSTSNLIVGSHTLSAVYSGDSTYAGSGSSNVAYTVNGVTNNTTTSLTVAPTSPSTYGQAVTLTATISPASATGTVVFKDGTTTLNGSPATIVNGVATFSTNSLIVGSHTLSAVYSGDSAYNSSTSSNVAYTVNSLTSTTTSLTANPASSSTYGQAVTLTATISPASTAGTVTFKDGTTTLNGSPVAIVNGVATYSISTLITGSHTLSAVYSGDSNYLGSTSSNIAYTVAGVTPYDPLIELQSLLANDRVVGDNFGDTVSLSSDGNTVLIGAPNKTVGLNINQGAAYIFVRSGATWVQQQKLTAGDGATGDRFGYAVSLSNDGNTALVGAYYKTVGANSSQGAAYTFVRNGATWTQQQQLSDTTTGAIGDWFGYAVSLSSDGNTALVGAYQKNNWQGVAYVFVRSGISWSQQQILTASDGVSGDWFGYAVSLSSDGNTALIGTPAKSIGQGVSYVFVRNGTSWLQQGLTLVALGGAAGNRFGDVVSLSGDGNTALIGAHGKNNWQGAAYIFVRSGTTWSQQQEVTAQGGDFGHWVSLSGDGNTALIGAFNEAINGIGGQGAAYIFVRSSTTWSQQQQLTASDGATSNWFGGSVSLSGNGKTALIGAHGKNNLQGAAYLFETQPTLSTSISLTANPASPSLYGQVVTLTATISPTTATGTVTFKDGTTTLNGSPVAIVNGVATYSISTLITGSHTLSAVYYGNSTYISSTSSNVGYAVAGVTLYDPLIELQSLLANDGVVGDNFGYAVSLSSDGNTVLIGAPNKTVGLNINQGATYIFVRSGATWVQQQKLTNGDGATGDRFGWSVALSNDGNTALVGASYKTVNGNSSQGAAYTFVRNGANWTQQQKLTANDGLANDNFGTSVSLSSDGNTALVGAPWKTIGGRGTQGAAYVFARSGATWTQQQQLIDATTGAAADYFGMSVSLSSDGNTALIGSPYKAINTNLHQGVAYVFTRSGTTWTQQQKLNDSVGTAYDELGWSVALSGDGNTAIMGAWNKTTNGNIQRGSTYIFVRSGTTWSQQTILTHSVGMAGDTFGNAVSLSSDGNMALVGASYKDVTGTSGNQGAAYTFVRSGTTWSQQQELMAGNAATGDRFGISASLSGSGKTALIGAFAKNSYQGAAYIFETQPTLSTSTNLTANPASTSTYGQAVTLTATISPASATGTVVFKDGTTTLNGSPATIASGVATFTTSSLSIGNHTLSANYSGDTKVNGSVNYLNYTVVSNSQWVVRSNTDNGLGTTAGTLSYILSQAVGSSPITITFELGSNTTINFTGPLMSSVPTEVTIDGGSTCSQPPAVIISGNAAIGDGLVLNGGNLLRNIWVKGFSNRQIVTNSPLAAFWKKNILQCVKVSR